PTDLYSLSLHDALPIYIRMAVVTEPEEVTAVRAAKIVHVRIAVAVDDVHVARGEDVLVVVVVPRLGRSGRRRRLGRCDHFHRRQDRKSTRLNSSHLGIS